MQNLNLEVKPTTLYNYGNKRTHLKSLLNIKLKDFNINHYDNWKKQMNETNISTRYKNDILKFLKSVLNFAMTWYDFNLNKVYNKMTKFSNASDIPKENTVYLRGNSGKAIVDNRSQHKQTFGRDIYNLLEDSFYIENYSMGKYALDYINSIINILLDESHNYRELEIEQIETLTQRINLIGNDVVKNKLKTMLLQCTKDKKDYQIKLLKEKRDNLNRQIAEMEE